MSSARTLALPPFGTILEAYCLEKIHLALPIEIYLGACARENVVESKRWGNLVTYLPENTPFEKYHWPVRGQNVVIIDLVIRDAQFATRFAIHLLDLYKPKVVVIHSDNSHFPLNIFTPYGGSYHG